MDLTLVQLLNLSLAEYGNLLKINSNIDNEIAKLFTADLQDRINKRIDFYGPSITLAAIKDFFPTLKQIDDTLKEPFYTRCFESPNKYTVGYIGSKKDAFDKGFTSFPVVGVNLWILIYDPVNDKKAFMFIRVESFYEIGTKHGMLLHLVTQTFPEMKIIAAGEVLVQEDVINGVYKFSWNASSGTITKALFDKREIQIGFLNMLYPPFDFNTLNLKFRPEETIIQQISMLEYNTTLKYQKVFTFIQIFSNIVLALLQNFLSKILMNSVIPFAFPNAPTVHEFNYLPRSDFSIPIFNNMPTFVQYNPAQTIDLVALANCSNPIIRNHLFVFGDKAECTQKIKEPEKIVEPRYCDLFASRPPPTSRPQLMRAQRITDHDE